jgi:hypothetical protein
MRLNKPDLLLNRKESELKFRLVPFASRVRREINHKPQNVPGPGTYATEAVGVKNSKMSKVFIDKR